MRNQARIFVARAMRKKVEQKLNILFKNVKGDFSFLETNKKGRKRT